MPLPQTIGTGRALLRSEIPPFMPAQWWDALRPETLFQDAALTTLAGVGDPVGGWVDRVSRIVASGTTTQRPTRSANELTFNGSSNLLDALSGVTRPSAETMYIVSQRANTASFHVLYGAISTNASRAFWNSGASSLAVNGTNALTVASSTARGVVCVAISGTSAVARFNSTEGISTTVAANGGTGFRIGAQQSGAFFNGTIAAVLYYPGVQHTSAQWSMMRAWASDYYRAVL